MRHDLVIDDEYICGVGSDCVNRGNKLEHILCRYIEIMQEVKDEALIEGETSRGLSTFLERVVILRNEITSLSNEINNTCLNFVDAIDQADEYLF